MFVFEWFLTMSRTIALILFTVALPALGAEIAVNVRDADIVRNGYAEIDLRLNLNWYGHVRRGVSPLRQLNQGTHSGIVS